MPGAPVIYFREVDEEQQSPTPRVRPLVGVRLIEVQLASQMRYVDVPVVLRARARRGIPLRIGASTLISVENYRIDAR